MKTKPEREKVKEIPTHFKPFKFVWRKLNEPSDSYVSVTNVSNFLELTSKLAKNKIVTEAISELNKGFKKSNITYEH